MDVHELTAAYALDALDAEEREAYEQHLAQCDDCRAELATLSESAAALAFGVASPAPAPELRSRILAAAAAERTNVVPLRRAWLVRATSAAAAVAACTAVGLGIWAGSLSNSLDKERSAHAAEAQAMEIYSDPAARKIALHGRSGTVAVDPTGRAALIVDRLPSAPDHKTYEAWVIPQGGAPKPAGTFGGGGAMTMTPLRERVPAGSMVAVTIERSGGVDAPTQTPILSAQT